ncbi:MAG TPA: helix-turn-helix domain-containing protein [Methylomirabilota bacterium]
MNPKDVLSLKEASTYLAIEEAALVRLANERRIPSLQLNGDWVFSKKSIDKWRSQQPPARA